MKIQGIYQGTKILNYTKHKVVINKGITNEKVLKIYNTYSNETGEMIHKLFYMTNKTGEWIKSKLNYYSAGKCFKTIRSVKNGTESNTLV